MDDIKKTILLKLAEEIENVEGYEGTEIDTFTFNLAKNLVIAELNNIAGASDTSGSFITLPTDTFDKIHDILLLLCMVMLDDMTTSVTSKCFDSIERTLMLTASKSVFESINQLKRC